MKHVYIHDIVSSVCLKMQIEWLTGGDCIAGMHEVVATKRTIDAINAAKEEKRSLWRVSSTVSGYKKFFVSCTRKKYLIKIDQFYQLLNLLVTFVCHM